MSRLTRSGFHAGGAAALYRAISQNPEYRQQLKVQKRQRIENLLTERQEQFRRAGFWSKQAMLKSIHLQVNREFSFSYCLF